MSDPSDKTFSVSVDSASDAARAAAAPMGGDQFAPGTLVAARYRIASIIGAGGMGEVYRAEDRKLGQVVALKFLPAHFTRDPHRVERLHDEVRLGRQVSHPNVCRTYDIGEWGDHSFVAMEYVDGEDLARLLKRIGRVSHERAVEIARGIAAGLSAAHAKGIVHRDLKPANVLIDSEGNAHITDFGLALLADDDAKQGAMAGTPAYVAPEQLAGKPATVQSDLYALGLVMYELFTGRRAHTAASFVERMRDVSEITHPSDFVRDIDPAVERVILRCLANDPTQRPRSAREVIEALGGDLLNAAIAAGETPSPRIVAAAGTEGWLPRATAWAILGGVVALLVLLFLARRETAITRYLAVDRTPDVLRNRATALLDSLGVPKKGTSLATFRDEPAYLEWLFAQKRWASLRKGPAPIVYNVSYGVSPKELEASSPMAAAPGRTTIEVDTQERLAFLLTAPEGEWTRRQLDWKPLLTAAGLDPQTLQTTTPKFTPPAAFDSRMAWTGTYPGDTTPIRIEAAAWRGTPVFFDVRGPWDEVAGAQEIPAVVKAVAWVLVAIALLLAWRNLRLRRVDRQGAIRVAAAVFLFESIARVLRMQYSDDFFTTLGDAWAKVGSMFLAGGVMFGIYVSLEPYMRRKWPEKLIGWSRLVAGRMRDPMVGRDVLFGVLTGLVYTLLVAATGLTGSWISGAPHGPSVGDFQTLNGARHIVAVVFGAAADGLYQGFLTFVLLVVMTMIFRKKALAVGAFAIVLVGLAFLGAPDPSALPAVIAAAALWVFVTVRYGLLTVIAMQATYAALAQLPFASGAAWATTLIAVPVIAVIALAVWAFRLSLGGQTVLSAKLLDE